MSKKISALELLKNEQEKLRETDINNINPIKDNDTTPSSDNVISKSRDHAIATRERKLKRRIEQHKKTFYMDDDMFKKWTRYEGTKLLEGEKITFQGVVEKLVKSYLKKNLVE